MREAHFFLTFAFIAFAIFHVYLSVLVGIEEQNGLMDSIFSGYKFVPCEDLVYSGYRFFDRRDV
jgi:Ni/Fe-hydrogenase 1 B-type cytochrome subunit